MGGARAPGPVRRAGLDDLAYVIYTSGSTGQPKGAMNTHRAISNRIQWMQDAFRLTSGDRVLQKTPFSFDVSVWEFFWPLLFGAELVIAEPGGHRDSSYLAQVIVDRGITTIHFVPSMLQLFLDDPRASECTSLRRVICSGEALPKAAQDRFFHRLDAELHNLYGPTEAAVDVTWWACDPNSDLAVRADRQADRQHPDPHRRRRAATRAGRDGRGAPASAASRSAVATSTGRSSPPNGSSTTPSPTGRLRACTGPATSRAGCPTATSSSWAAPTSRSRSAASGWSSARSRRPSRRSTASARPSSSRASDRAATSSSSPTSREPTGERTTDDDLRNRLLAQLPAYMVPTTFVAIEQFPLSPNGKVDRKALPAPPRIRPELGTPYAPPRSALERLVADAWRRILELDSVGVNDRFFELGGTSLQAARFVNEMQTELGESIFVVSLFAAPSVAEYAAFLQDQYPAAVARLVGADQPVPIRAVASAPVSEADVERLRAAVPTVGARRRRAGRPEPAGDIHPQPAAVRDDAAPDHAGRAPRPVRGERAPAPRLLDAARSARRPTRAGSAAGSTARSGRSWRSRA